MYSTYTTKTLEHDTSNARGRYLLDREYNNRCERRQAVYENVNDDNKNLKRAPKYNDRKYTQQMIGVQLAKNAAWYTVQALMERMPASILEDNTISEINKKGTKPQQNEHVEMAAQHAEAVRKKRLLSDK